MSGFAYVLAFVCASVSVVQSVIMCCLEKVLYQYLMTVVQYAVLHIPACRWSNRTGIIDLNFNTKFVDVR